MYKTLGLAVMVLAIAGCGDSSDSSSSSNSSDGTTTKTQVNVASQSKKATTQSAYDNANTVNLIDGDTATTWTSNPGDPVVITFEGLESINKIEVNRVSSSASAGTNPDILIELSTDNTTYKTSDATKFGTGDIPCSSSSLTATTISCTLSEQYTAKYMRITSQNGKAFEFQEVKAYSLK